MRVLRVGTRGSDLALTQTRWVCDRLLELHPSLTLEEIVIKTHGDVARDQIIDASWPVGAFVSALEHALLEGAIDLAVHSHKDLQTNPTAGLTIAATPEREAPHDVILTLGPTGLEELQPGSRIGTGSPRRTAQILRMGDFQVVPIRGNVPTRIGKLGQDGLEGVILAAAGLRRLQVEHPHTIPLPVENFLPAPAQGALAVQVREGDEAEPLAKGLDHGPTRRAVTAERAFLRNIDAGCHTPVGALATVEGDTIHLHGRLFSDDYAVMVEGVESGQGPEEVGGTLARRLLSELGTLGSC